MHFDVCLWKIPKLWIWTVSCIWFFQWYTFYLSSCEKKTDAGEGAANRLRDKQIFRDDRCLILQPHCPLQNDLSLKWDRATRRHGEMNHVDPSWCLLWMDLPPIALFVWLPAPCVNTVAFDFCGLGRPSEPPQFKLNILVSWDLPGRSSHQCSRLSFQARGRFRSRRLAMPGLSGFVGS